MRGALRWVALGAVTLATIELLSFGLVMLRREEFSQRTAVLRRLDGALDEYPRFLALTYDPVLGWDNRASKRDESQACDGRPVIVTTRPDRSRVTPEIDTGPLVLLVGDSFTFGSEVDDEETWAWLLSERLRVPVRNHGVSAYSPVQATLKLERLAGVYPTARVAVLGIMHTNVKRMLSRYRPAEHAESAQLFGFKPYADGARILPNPNGPRPVPVEQLPALADAALRDDYFARPEVRLPFTRAVVQLLTSRAFYWQLEEDRSGSLDGYYADAGIEATLAFVVERFVATAAAQGLSPVIAFVPRSRHDRTDAEPAVIGLRNRLGARATVTAVGAEPGDWERYSIGDKSGCHPSAYGHELIATHLARVVAPLLAPVPPRDPGL